MAGRIFYLALVVAAAFFGVCCHGMGVYSNHDYKLVYRRSCPDKVSATQWGHAIKGMENAGRLPSAAQENKYKVRY